ncbi:MAG TPA: MipA/OmpV family protein [Burkholderiales bacterium]|nr:MipA/OmpV family protein [Burkholderiales bacterium]
MQRLRAFILLFALWAGAAAANSDPLSGLASPGGVAIGVLPRMERSPYRGGGTRYDFEPLYLYEGDQVYLHSHSLGVKFGRSEARRFEVFLKRRFEGHPTDDIPPSLAGMARREPGIDAGFSGQVGGGWGIAFAEVLHDVSAASRGSELRLGYKYPIRSGRWWVRPYAFLAMRSSKLNDYYYGVRPEEATASRPAYHVDAAALAELGVYTAYQLSGRWRLLAGASVVQLPRAISESPIVGHRVLHRLELGAIYDLSPDYEASPGHRPLIARFFYGASSECNVLQIAELRCTSTHTQDRTGVAGFELGRPFIDRLNGWPLDLAGFVGLIKHSERGLQADVWQINAYIKGYFYGFPWDARLRTRLGLGVGLSYAKEPPFSEQRDQAARGRTTSRLLNIFDPTADISVGDLIGVKKLRDTYVGAGVSHRSGIFGSSQLLGNVNGGSNYIYGYIETSIK